MTLTFLLALLGGGRFSRSVGRTLRGGMWVLVQREAQTD